jgi:3D (Asp-Asp-Asp) domain-containing protein
MYCLKGTTATGIPVGPGVVATDPAYIPLGTRMEIPGYGAGVAADTGGAVIGWFVDMWVASCAQASAYGKRTITITLFD